MECRRFHRLLLQVDIIHCRKSDHKQKKAKIKNISIGGICITTHEEPLSQSDIYMLQFSLPGREKIIKAEGRVVWNREYSDNNEIFFDNGIEFIKMQDRFKKMIEEYSIGSVEAD